jgi:hypothetical protein
VQVRGKINKLVKNFKPEYYFCIRIHQVKHPKNSGNNSVYNVAHAFVTGEGKPNEKRVTFLRTSPTHNSVGFASTATLREQEAFQTGRPLLHWQVGQLPGPFTAKTTSPTP